LLRCFHNGVMDVQSEAILIDYQAIRHGVKPYFITGPMSGADWS
jgi:hypothetical protein